MSFSKEAVGGFFTHAHVGSTSLLERMGDHCMFSLRTFFEGRKYIVLSKYTEYEKPRQLQRVAFENDHVPFNFLSLDCIKAIVGLILIPLGIILKAASFVTSSSTREDYRSWSKPQLEPSFIILLNKILEHEDDYIMNGKTHKDLNTLAPWNVGETFGAYRSKDLDSAVFSHIKKFPDSKITYLSYGCKALLQDWLLLSKMVKEGVKEIHVDLVDERKPSYNEWRGLVYLQEQLAKEGVTLTFDWYKTVDDCRSSNSQRTYHFVTATSLDDETTILDVKGRRDLIKLKEFLVDAGKIFQFRSGSLDSVVKNGLTIPLKSSHRVEALIKELEFTRNLLHAPEELLIYGIHSPRYALSEDLYMIHHLIRLGYKKIEIHISLEKERIYDDSKAYYEALQEHVQGLKFSGIESIVVKAFEKLPDANTIYDIVTIHTADNEKALVDAYKVRLKKDGDLFLDSMYQGKYHYNASKQNPLRHFDRALMRRNQWDKPNPERMFGMSAIDVMPRGGGLFGAAFEF